MTFLRKHVSRIIAVTILAFIGGAVHVFAGTGGPVITGTPYATNIMGSGAQILWTTDDPSDSTVMYDVTSGSYAQYSLSRCDAGGMVTSHCVNLMNLLPHTTYYYKVVSTNATGTGMQGGYSFVSVGDGSSTDTISPSVPATPYASPVSGTQVTLTWTASTDNVGVTGYKVYRNGTYLESVTTLTYSDTTVSPVTSYAYYIKAIDAAGNESSPSNNAYVVTPSSGGTQTIPTPPTDLRLGGTVTNTSIPLAWNDNSTNEDKWNVERSVTGTNSWTLLSQITVANTTSYTDSSVTAGTSYDYRVQACLSGSGCSTYTSLVGVSAAASTASVPSTPANFTGVYVANGSYGPSVNLQWSDVANETTYNVYQRVADTGTWSLAGSYSANITSIQIAGSTSGTYEYHLNACNTSGCSSDSTSLRVVMGTQTGTTDTTAPLPPSTIAASPLSSTQIQLSWSGASDNVGVTGYKVYRNGAYLIGVTTTTFTDSNVSAATSYAYYVKVVDAAGNESATSATITATTTAVTTTSTQTGDTTAPIISGVYTTNMIGSGAQIIWTTDDASDSRVAYGIIPSEGHSYPSSTNWTCTAGGNVTSHCVNLTALSAGTKYYYRVLSKNSAGLETVSPEYSFFAASSTTQSTTQMTGTPLPVSVTVTRGESFCDGLVGKTMITFVSSPSTGAYFLVTMKGNTGSSTTVEMKPGTYAIPNGSYYWEGVAVPGFVLSSGAHDSVLIEKSCTTTTTTSTMMTSPTPTIQTTTETFPNAYVLLVGDAEVHVAYGGAYIEAGAKGYFEKGGSPVPTKRLLGGLNTSVPGTYKVIYQLLDAKGTVVASAARVVIVDEPIKIAITPVSEEATMTTEPVPTATPLAAPTAVPVVVESATAINTSEQYMTYCDDPNHRVECQTYATTKIVTEMAPVSVDISSEMLTTTPKEELQLPGGATNLPELKTICTQSQYVNQCAEFFVREDMMEKTAAQAMVTEVLAAREEVVQVFTERIGARMFQDSDLDTITDYDEINLYHTDPKKADTNNDGVKDGAQLLAGSDPLRIPQKTEVAPAKGATTTPDAPVEKIAYENPKLSGEQMPELLTVTDVKGSVEEHPDTKATSTKIQLAGKALPNSFVTLFIFSDPIVVTVRTDASGAWTYTLDQELPDGSHQVISAITDTGGRILAKSEPLPFVKEAAAVSLGSADLLGQETTPGFFSGMTLYATIAVLIGLLGVTFPVIGFIVRRKEKDTPMPPFSPSV